MSWLARRLALSSGRSEVVRVLLVALGGALGTVLLLAAALVSAVRGGDCRRDGCVQGHYRTALLDQAGLRPGVVLGLVLMVVPVLVFLGSCARISAAARERRLAALRLAGATPGQVRLLAAADTGLPAALGAAVGLVGFLVAKVLLERHSLAAADHVVRRGLAAGLSYAEVSVPGRALPTDVPVPVLRFLLVVLLVPALSAVSAVLALRQVETTPLGTVRRARPQPRATFLVVLLAGLALLVAPLAVQTLVLPLLAAGVVLVLLALAAGGSWVAARTGAAAAGTGRPALLLAARRLQADPRAQGRALSGVVMAVFAASGAVVLRAATLAQQSEDTGGPPDTFHRDSYDLVLLALLVALLVAAAGLLVSSCEAVLERRHTLASLWAAGVPLATLRRAVLLQTLLPAVPAVLLAWLTGTAATTVFVAPLGVGVFAWLGLLAVLAVALAAVALASLLTLPLVRRSTGPAELRQA